MYLLKYEKLTGISHARSALTMRPQKGVERKTKSDGGDDVMAVIKCKTCRGDIYVEEGSTICECVHCGTKQTVPDTKQDVPGSAEENIGKKVPETRRKTVVVRRSGDADSAALMKQGKQALEGRDWSAARSCFEQILTMDARNSGAFFGIFLARAECTDEEEYIRRICAYPGERQEFALPEAKEKIKAAVRAFTVDDYLSEEEIRRQFHYDLRYFTCNRESMQRYAEHQRQALQNDQYYARAIRYARGTDHIRLEKLKTELSSNLDISVGRAAEQEKSAVEEKRKAYEVFLTEAERKVEQLHQQAQAKKYQDYKRLCRQVEEAKTSVECSTVFRELETRFPDYEDSAAVLQRCSEMAEGLRLQEENAEMDRKKKNRMAAVLVSIMVLAAVAAILIVTKALTG